MQEPPKVLFLSTLPARGATRLGKLMGTCSEEISIHAPREGSDYSNQLMDMDAIGISIHAPREGSDPGS